MPIYEYICEDCQTHFEKIVLNKTQEIACPKCAGKKNAIQLSVFSSTNGMSNGASAKSSGGFSGGGGSCCGGGLGLARPRPLWGRRRRRVSSLFTLLFLLH